MSSEVVASRAYLRVSEIANNRRTRTPGIIPVSAATWWSWVKANKAPQPIRLSAGVTVWRAADVLAFAESLAGEAA
ncbi:helix-turn-helix transcriptional regulator [Rhodanobacter soli]|uniref:Prophage regulatory protein n=1 Tax=Rhodanobacter soli TaxID=590609 RepID=A0ABV2Q0Y2_9GAMM